LSFVNIPFDSTNIDTFRLIALMEGRPRTPSITDTIVMINTVDSAMKVAHDILSTLEAASADLAASQQYVKKYMYATFFYGSLFNFY